MVFNGVVHYKQACYWAIFIEYLYCFLFYFLDFALRVQFPLLVPFLLEQYAFQQPLRVIGKMGVISVHTLDYMISKVDNVCIETGFW